MLPARHRRELRRNLAESVRHVLREGALLVSQVGFAITDGDAGRRMPLRSATPDRLVPVHAPSYPAESASANGPSRRSWSSWVISARKREFHTSSRTTVPK